MRRGINCRGRLCSACLFFIQRVWLFFRICLLRRFIRFIFISIFFAHTLYFKGGVLVMYYYFFFFYLFVAIAYIRACFS